MPTILVTDSDKRPIVRAKVYVKWKGGGLSQAETDESGMADLKCSAGTTEYIEINGKNMSIEIYLPEDKVFQITSRR